MQCKIEQINIHKHKQTYTILTRKRKLHVNPPSQRIPLSCYPLFLRKISNPSFFGFSEGVILLKKGAVRTMIEMLLSDIYFHFFDFSWLYWTYIVVIDRG